MAYESRQFQTTTPATPPAATDPLVDNTASGDVQAIKLLDPTAGSTTPLIGQKARTGSMPVAFSTEDAALLADLLTNTTFATSVGVAIAGQSLEAGGSGLVGWLASLRKAITDRLPSALVSGRLDVNVGAGSVSVSNLPSDPTTGTAQTTANTRIGDLTETAPASDTASSGLNGRLQRVAQRITSLIALLPASLGQKTKANSLAVAFASDQDALPVTDNGSSLTVDGTFWQATQPVSLASLPALAASTNNIGDVDVLTLPALPTGANVIGAVTQSGTWSFARTSRALSASDVHAPAANTAAVLTYAAAGAGVAHVISGVAWSYSADPTGGNLKIEDGSGTTVFSMDVTSKGAGFVPFEPPRKGTANTALIVTLAAGGASVTGKVSALGRWTE